MFPSRTEPDSAIREGWLYGLLLAAAVLVYVPALRGGFVWDDGSMLVANAAVQSPGGLRAIWIGSEGHDYLPVTFTMLWAEWRCWGLNPAGYRAANIFLHALNVILLWRVLERLKVPGAWLAALLFAVHPVNVASVAWIAERKNTLSMAFFLTTILWFLRHEVDRKRWTYGLAIFAFVLALLSKSAAVVLPPALLLFAWWQRGRITPRDWLRTAPFFLLALVCGLVTIWFQNHRAIADGEVVMGGFVSRLATAGCAIWFYIGKIVFPRGLSMLYPPWQISLPIALLPGALFAVLLFVAWRFRAGWGRAVFFALAYFTLALLPVLGFVRMYYFRFSPVADQWQYFSAPALLALAAAGFTVASRKPRWKFPAGILAAWVVVLFGTLTWTRAQTFRNAEVFWREVLRTNSVSWVAHSNLAVILLQQNRFPEALSEAREAVALAPNALETRMNLGAVLDHGGSNAEAVSEFRQAVRLRPDAPHAHRGLATALQRGGLRREAIAEYHEALRLRPEDFGLRMKLGSLLYEMNDSGGAVAEFREAVRLRPDDAEARNSFASALFLAGKRHEAVAEYREALRRNPDHQGARQNLETLLRLPPQ